MRTKHAPGGNKEMIQGEPWAPKGLFDVDGGPDPVGVADGVMLPAPPPEGL